MYVDTSGNCKEVCGDGKRYHETVCDDGNTGSGDGCTSKCTVEPNYICRGGYQGNRDTCTWLPVDLLSATVNSKNFIMLEFSRPIKTVTGNITT